MAGSDRPVWWCGEGNIAQVPYICSLQTDICLSGHECQIRLSSQVEHIPTELLLSSILGVRLRARATHSLDVLPVACSSRGSKQAPNRSWLGQLGAGLCGTVCAVGRKEQFAWIAACLAAAACTTFGETSRSACWLVLSPSCLTPWPTTPKARVSARAGVCFYRYIADRCYLYSCPVVVVAGGATGPTRTPIHRWHGPHSVPSLSALYCATACHTPTPTALRPSKV